METKARARREGILDLDSSGDQNTTPDESSQFPVTAGYVNKQTV